MELFCSLLAGFFLWLFFFHLERRRRAWACEAAGPLLMKVEPRRLLVWLKRFPMAVSIALMTAVLAGMVYLACLSLIPEPSPSGNQSLAVFGRHLLAIALVSYGFVLHMLIAFYVGMLPGLFAMLIAGANASMELRERGILFGPQTFKFASWNEVAEWRWFQPKSILGIAMCWGIPRFRKNTRLTLVENSIAPGQKEAVTAIVGRFIAVYDRDATLLAKPEETVMPATPATTSRRSRFLHQFDLQSLLLLVVVVGCFAGLYGIHYRRVQPQHAAMNRLAAFAPVADAVNGVPWGLNFSNCVKKPTDDDLALLKPLTDLCLLDLSGSPITDAGLKHLEGLKYLAYITLTDTAVTADGAARLQQTLPNASISYGPAKSPHVVSSAKPSP